MHSKINLGIKEKENISERKKDKVMKR